MRHLVSKLIGACLLAGSLVNQAMAGGPYKHNGAEVTDTATGLIWKRCVEGMTWDAAADTCAGKATTMTHEQALIAAKRSGGYRMPNVKELVSLVNRTRAEPAIDNIAFPSTPSDASWSSSPSAAVGTAWGVGFDSGRVRHLNRRSAYVVRLVR